MITQDQFNEVSEAVFIIKSADQDFKREFQQVALHAKIPAGKDIFVDGDYPESIALVLSGVVRVYIIGENGREITLYRFGLGESCVLTANAILNQSSFPAIASVEEDVEAIIIPGEYFRKWVNKYELWRDFVLELVSVRLASIMVVIDQILFQRMDQRVASWLLNHADDQLVIDVTHREIASDLGSSREVISRILEDFRQAGFILAGRGTIEIIDFEGLRSRSVL
jgi:CRP/FNR family transcriptional regulator